MAVMAASTALALKATTTAVTQLAEVASGAVMMGLATLERAKTLAIMTVLAASRALAM